MEQVFSPGQRGYFTVESYRGQSDHPEYMAYLRDEHGPCVGVQTGEIMQEWVDVPIVSEGYSTCYPLIAVDGMRTQMIHMSRDPWRMTNTDNYWRRLRDWGAKKCEVSLLRVKRSALSDAEVDDIRQIMRPNFIDINLGVDSRFGMVVDGRSRLMLVQLTDLKELRKYQI